MSRQASSQARGCFRRCLRWRRLYFTSCFYHALHQLRAHDDLLAKLLMWEIDKTYKTGFTDIDRCIEGAQWYVDTIIGMLGERTPLGLVLNVASWNYPFSVLLHAVLVQVLAGNAVIAKTPTDGGFISLSLAFALARRGGLPLTLVSGAGSELSDALVKKTPWTA